MGLYWGYIGVILGEWKIKWKLLSRGKGLGRHGRHQCMGLHH